MQMAEMLHSLKVLKDKGYTLWPTIGLDEDHFLLYHHVTRIKIFSLWFEEFTFFSLRSC